MNKEQILEDVKKHLQVIDDEILDYGFAFNLTTKKEGSEYINNFTTISKNFNNHLFCPSPYVKTTII